jgi:hypothetical protein
MPVSKCTKPRLGIRTVEMMAPHCGQDLARFRLLSELSILQGTQQALIKTSLPDANRRVCSFRLNQPFGIQITPRVSIWLPANVLRT